MIYNFHHYSFRSAENTFLSQEAHVEHRGDEYSRQKCWLKLFDGQWMNTVCYNSTMSEALTSYTSTGSKVESGGWRWEKNVWVDGVCERPAPANTITHSELTGQTEVTWERGLLSLSLLSHTHFHTHTDNRLKYRTCPYKVRAQLKREARRLRDVCVCVFVETLYKWFVRVWNKKFV